MATLPGPVPNPEKLAELSEADRIYDRKPPLALKEASGVHDVEQTVATEQPEAGIAGTGQRDRIDPNMVVGSRTVIELGPAGLKVSSRFPFRTKTLPRA